MKCPLYRAVCALLCALLLTACAAVPGGRPTYDAGDFSPVPYEEMEYRRPDMAALEELFTYTASFAETAKRRDAVALTRLLSSCWDAYDSFYTMLTLAMLRSDADQTDEYYAGAYRYCEEQSVRVEELLDALLIACAASEAEVDSSYLAGYDDPAVEPYPDRALELMVQENELLLDYWDAMMLDEITVNGQTVSYLDYLSDPSLSDAAYYEAQLAYAKACNEAAAPLYIRLIRVRRELAQVLGYDSYESYQYDAFARDYSPRQAAAYLDALASDAAPVCRRIYDASPYDAVSYAPLTEERLLSLLEQATSSMGDTVTDAMALMRQYSLYDVSSDSRKSPQSYTVYLYSYGLPFCFVDAYGDVEDLLTLSHEFGHFADSFCNYDATGSLDLSEFYSQAMSHLTVLRCRELFSQSDFRDLLLIHLLDAVSTFTEQAAFAAFESAACALPDEELTVENLNALALSCAVRFGAATEQDELYAYYWAQISHLFDTPFYVISYCVSNDAAIQLAALERAEPGAGVVCYNDVLDWQSDAFLSEVERVGLESPFAPGRCAENAALLQELWTRYFPELTAQAAA
ncbi:MAG: hypothetical protein IJU18_07815 [Oscillospiraceae bacterium]|nr:hypothetical protein [Oscillospiraceae bacterium]